MSDYIETFTIDESFGIDEAHLLFRYKSESKTEILPIDNIVSCTINADLFSLPKELFHNENVPGFGNTPVVNDLKEFSKAVLSNDVILSIYFYDKSQKLICFRKKYSSKNEPPFEIMRKINTLTDR